MDKLILSFNALIEQLNKSCFIWGERNKQERLIRIGWNARQAEIDQLRQKLQKAENVIFQYGWELIDENNPHYGYQRKKGGQLAWEYRKNKCQD